MSEDQNEVSELEVAIRAAFDESVSDDQSEDDIKLEMITAGATFKNVTRLYNQFMIDAGLAISKADRAEIVESTLEGLDLASEEDFQSAVAAVMSAVAGTNEKSAGGLVRSYGKKNYVEVYVKPKGESSPRTGLISNLYDQIVSNPMQTDEELTAYVMKTAEEKDSTNFSNHLSSHLGVLKLARRVAEKYAA